MVQLYTLYISYSDKRIELSRGIGRQASRQAGKQASRQAGIQISRLAEKQTFRHLGSFYNPLPETVADLWATASAALAYLLPCTTA